MTKQGTKLSDWINLFDDLFPDVSKEEIKEKLLTEGFADDFERFGVKNDVAEGGDQ